jgi:hypothetical protein
MGRRVVPLALGLATLAVGVAPADAAEPIEGRWNFRNGVDEFYATGPGTFASRKISPGDDSCASSDLGARFSGSGSRYTGTVRYYNSGSCAFAGDGPAEITIDASGNQATMATSPPGAPCCQRTYPMTRVPPPARDPRANRLLPDLPALLNRNLVELQARYRQVVRLASGRRYRTHLALLGGYAARMRAAVTAYHASDAAETSLRACAIGAFRTVETGARIKVERAGRGLTALARCLAPFRDLAPNNRPGSATPTPPRAGPNDRLAGSYVGNGPAVSDISFTVTRNADGVYTIGFDFHVFVRCSDGRTGYLANIWRPFAYAAKLAEDGTFRIRLQTVGTGGGDLSDVVGKIAGGSATGTVQQLKGNCASRVEPWKAAVRR